jgi:ubiquinone/menaquinone biosynthesis C-methylase UbiE
LKTVRTRSFTAVRAAFACGAGHLACDLARDVGPGGRIIAIDKSSDSVDATQARVLKEELAGSVTVQVGDATDLEFPSESFDFVVAVQVHCFVPNVSRAIEEAAGVLRKGGRLFVLESDWEMCIWNSKDPVLTRRIIAARA